MAECRGNRTEQGDRSMRTHNVYTHRSIPKIIKKGKYTAPQATWRHNFPVNCDIIKQCMSRNTNRPPQQSKWATEDGLHYTDFFSNFPSYVLNKLEIFLKCSHMKLMTIIDTKKEKSRLTTTNLLLQSLLTHWGPSTERLGEWPQEAGDPFRYTHSLAGGRWMNVSTLA